jgi:hypothetical protein
MRTLAARPPQGSAATITSPVMISGGWTPYNSARCDRTQAVPRSCPSRAASRLPNRVTDTPACHPAADRVVAPEAGDLPHERDQALLDQARDPLEVAQVAVGADDGVGAQGRFLLGGSTAGGIP